MKSRFSLMPSLARLAGLAAFPSILACVSINAAIPAVRAETLIEESFRGKTPGIFYDASFGKGKVRTWRGPAANPFGSVEIITQDDPATSVLAIRDTGAEANQAPAIIIEWPAIKSGENNIAVVEFKYKTLQPANDKSRYRTVVYVAGNQAGQSIATILFDDGDRIYLHDGRAHVRFGKYLPGQWQTFRLEVDTGARTCSLKIDDRLVANKLPWINPENPGFGQISIRSDMSPTDRNGELVFLLSDLKVSRPD
ncbi:MAG: hypothetical protein LBK99_20980 [Opitutaceae bacterium]|jgi:hypothetical protein|nr:hypothetical protein [Opitutaceae bacterium]